METVTLLLSALLIALAAAAYFVLGAGNSKDATSNSPIAMKADKYQPFKLLTRTQVSPNTVQFRFALQHAAQRVGLPVGKHMLLRCTDAEGKPVSRAYTPVSSDDDLGHFDLLVKLYSNGKMSQHLQALQVGSTIDVRGPQGSLEYKGDGVFNIVRRGSPTPQVYNVKSVGMIAGGSGITPMLQLLRDVSKRSTTDFTKLSLLYANVTEADILLRSELESLRESRSLTDIFYTLDRPSESWTGGQGFITTEMIKANLPPPASSTLVLLCGPPPMVNMMEKHLLALGYTEEMYFKY